MFSVYVPASCNQEGCKSKTVHSDVSKFKIHLKSVYLTGAEDREEAVKGLYEDVTETERSARKRAREDAQSKGLNASKSKKSKLRFHQEILCFFSCSWEPARPARADP